MCKHETCANLDRQNAGKGIAVVVLYSYLQYPTALLGLERSGPYAGKLNLCAGKMEQQDNNCWLQTLVRELKEEFKIHLKFGPEFDAIFRGSDGRLRVFMEGRTPVFVGVFPNISRRKLNPLIAAANSNPMLPASQKEMAKVELVRLDNLTVVPETVKKKLNAMEKLQNQFQALTLPKPQISSFAMSVLAKVKANYTV